MRGGRLGGLRGPDFGAVREAVAHGDPARRAGAAAQREDHEVGFGLLIFEHFEGGGGDAGDQQRLIDRFDVARAALGGELFGLGAGGVEALADQLDRAAETLDRGDLVGVGVGRHEDGGLRADRGGGEGERLPVIAGGGGDQSARQLLAAQAADEVQPAAHLERAGGRDAFELERDMRAPALGERDAVDEGRGQRQALADDCGGASHIVERGRDQLVGRRRHERYFSRWASCRFSMVSALRK